MAGGGYDWNGDTIPDFAMLGDLGDRVRVYSGAPAGVHVLGGPCPGRGPEPRIGCTGSATLGADLPVHLSQVEPDRFAVLLLGGLRKLGSAQDCSPMVAPARAIPARTHAVSPGKGAASVSVHIPNDPSLQGRVLHAQWVLIDPAGSLQKATRVLAAEIQ